MNVPEEYDETFPELRDLEAWPEYELESFTRYDTNSETSQEITVLIPKEGEILGRWIEADADEVYSLEEMV